MADVMQALVQRLEDLEIRYAFQQDHLQQLDDVLREQADTIERLTSELSSLREQVAQGLEGEAPPEEQVPPHY